MRDWQVIARLLHRRLAVLRLSMAAELAGSAYWRRRAFEAIRKVHRLEFMKSLASGTARARKPRASAAMTRTKRGTAGPQKKK